MMVLSINGSPNRLGCTHTALKAVETELESQGISVVRLHIGTSAIQGCTACGGCARTHRCVFSKDDVNRALDLMEKADGLLIGSPVYYASPNGSMLSFLDRMFFAGSGFAHKVGAAVVSARRAGTTASLDALFKYFTISQMPVASSQYWNMVHGNTPQEVERDLEGMQIMRTLGRSMAFLIKCIRAGRQAGIALPQAEPRTSTNFIR